MAFGGHRYTFIHALPCMCSVIHCVIQCYAGQCAVVLEPVFICKEPLSQYKLSHFLTNSTAFSFFFFNYVHCMSCLKSCKDLLAELKYNHKCRQTKKLLVGGLDPTLSPPRGPCGATKFSIYASYKTDWRIKC